MQTVISKKTQTGQDLTISYDNGMWIAVLDGKKILETYGAGAYIPAKGLHVLGGKIGLSREEGALLIATERAALAAVVTEPTRADLIAEYHALIEAQEAAYTRAHDQQDARAMAIRERYDTKIAAAEQAICDYDATHPEETAARKAERAASLESSRWM